MPRATRSTAKKSARGTARTATRKATTKATKTTTRGTKTRVATAKTAKTKRTAAAPPPKTAARTRSTTKAVKATKTPARAAKTPTKAPAKAPAKTTTKAPAKRVLKPEDKKFLAEQRELLMTERATYTQQAETLKAEADQLAEDMEPGDIQFDEESGEGGTMNVERERDLALSAQAQAAVEEIDKALAKIADGTYGYCEQCGQPIPKARLKALPYAALCVACKSGGLSRR
ncbi:MAG TPA: TraR/DksA C4-type zinc finger protein [Acidimicrobiales bacterium]|jgi:DnaK suppressor protein|nr:TraR/DksA C4-type zinc finger protein [Acidimicrobiales bacterium]